MKIYISIYCFSPAIAEFIARTVFVLGTFNREFRSRQRKYCDDLISAKFEVT